jgi:hypothetical protein
LAPSLDKGSERELLQLRVRGAGMMWPYLSGMMRPRLEPFFSAWTLIDKVGVHLRDRLELP